MADAIISGAVERVAAIIEEQIRNKVNLVRSVEEEVQSLCRFRDMWHDAVSQRRKNKDINGWLARLEQTYYEIEDILDEWNYAILELKMEKVCSFIPSSYLCCKKFAFRHDIAEKIQHAKEQFEVIFKEKNQYDSVMCQPDTSPKSWRIQSTSLIDLDEVQGRTIDRDILVSKIVSKGHGQEKSGLHILSVVGMGGLGKTTLAQLVYNDSRMKESFDLRIWICVSDPFDVDVIAKGIIEGVERGSSSNTSQLDMLFKDVINIVSSKKFFLVLDDVWTDEYHKWEPLKNSLKHGKAGSTILVTTRNEKVAKRVGTSENDIYRLGQLSNEECWSLLSRMAFSGRNKEECEKLRGIGENIANKCKGLPLAAKALGDLLQSKSSLKEWEHVLNTEIWQLEKAEQDIFPHLLLSYNELSPALKCCFSYCGVFPKDSEINVENLIHHWIAQGYLDSNIGSAGDVEFKGRQYFDTLLERSLFQEIERSDLDGPISRCKMHDIVHDFAQFLRKSRSNGRGEVGTMKVTCQSCTPLLVSHVKKYRSFFCSNEKHPPDLCDCLKSLRILSISWCSFQSAPHEIGNLIHLRWLELNHCELSREDTKIICKLYKLQFLWLSSCNLQKIPWEIGNLRYLRHLDLSHNNTLEKLPESVCGLQELRTLNVDNCFSLGGLPQGIHKLISLKHLHNENILSIDRYPQGIAQLTGLLTLREFSGGGDCGKLQWLKNLNHLSGHLKLRVILNDDLENMVKDAREAELGKKEHIQELELSFEDRTSEKDLSPWMNVLDVLEPHQNLQKLKIFEYKGSTLSGWITSSLNQLTHINLCGFNHLSSLLALGKLPCLEIISIVEFFELQSVRREFLGIATTATTRDMNVIESSSLPVSVVTNAIGFPKLKELEFRDCPKWTEWEDITVEEEDSTTVSIMPYLTKLTIENCTALTALPHRLLRKASSLEMVYIPNSTELQQRYRDEDGSTWKSTSRNPHFRVEFSASNL